MRRVRLVLAIATAMVAMLAAGQAPAMAQVVVSDNGSCDNGFFENGFCDGVGQDGLSQGLANSSDSGTVNISFTVSHTP